MLNFAKHSDPYPLVIGFLKFKGDIGKQVQNSKWKEEQRVGDGEENLIPLKLYSGLSNKDSWSLRDDWPNFKRQ